MKKWSSELSIPIPKEEVSQDRQPAFIYGGVYGTVLCNI